MDNTKEGNYTSASKKLLYRNQFIFGPFFVDDLKSWKRIKISSSIISICLTAHPDLDTFQATYQNKSITLLGFILDPDNPKASDSDIINDLIRSFSNSDDLFERTGKLGGRWIIVVDDGQEVRLFNDASGLRQVFYSDVHQTKDLWCASQPSIVAEILKLQMDEAAVDFISWFQSKSKEYWWPGDSSPYKKIRHLSPNHYLNLETGGCHRYWPNKGLSELSLDEAIEKIPRILSGFMQSAANRFDLALGVSAGWDSRLVLASCKEIRHRISFYSAKRPDMSWEHPDIEVPFRLLSKLSLKHDIIEQHPRLRSEFVEIFKRNVPFAHDVRLPGMQANLDYYHQSKVAVTGNVSEVAKCCYRLSEPGEQELIVSKLSLLTMVDHPFAIKFFKKWLLGLGEIYNFNVLDLFHWEQKVGNWFAMNCLEFDSAWKDIFVPFNSRSLLIDFLSIDEQYRKKPTYELYNKLMFSLWPEVLSEPINPPYHKPQSLKHRIRRYVSSLRRR